jgi:hypothetical protein
MVSPVIVDALRRVDLGPRRTEIGARTRQLTTDRAAPGRKYWRFAGGQCASGGAAMIRGLLANAKADGHEPHAWKPADEHGGD